MDLRFLFSTKVQKEEGRKEEKKGQDRKKRRRKRKRRSGRCNWPVEDNPEEGLSSYCWSIEGNFFRAPQAAI